jgi:parallel beta-helix repeat protein
MSRSFTRTLRAWTNTLRAPLNRTVVRRPIVRLRLLDLEDRTTPSQFLVKNANDSGADSLRDAITQANANPGADEVIFDTTGVFATPQVINLASTLKITDSLTITGTGVANLTVTGGGTVRVLDSTAANLTLTGFTVTGGLADDSANAPNGQFGGGLRANGSVTIDRMLFTGNTALGSNYFDAGAGGGIGMAPFSTLIIRNSTISGNSADEKGGGIFMRYEGTLLVDSSTISGNNSTPSATIATGYYGGGGIFLLGAGSWTIRNSTISNNTTAGSGGGINAEAFFGSGIGSLTIQDSTITGNNADVTGAGTLGYGFTFGGGGIAVVRASGGGTVTVSNSIVAGNTNGTSPDIQSTPLIGTSFSAIGNSTGFTDTSGAGNIAPGTNLMLGTLVNNGGPTLTIAPQTGSPLIDAGSDGQIPSGVGADQRGIPFYRSFGSAVDIGSVEVQPVSNAPFVTASTSNIFGSGGTDYTFTVTYLDPGGTLLGINASTVVGNNHAVLVTGPGGFSQLATYVSIDTPGNGTPRTATYKITAPGGSWDGIDNGHYTVQMQAGQVADLDGEFAPQVNIGSFVVVVSPIVVTNANDSGPGSLHEAIDLANLDPGDDEIIFDQTFFSTPRTINLASPLPAIPANSGALTITGPGVANLKVDAGGHFRVLDSAAPKLTLSGFEISGGTATNDLGGGLLTSGQTVLDHMLFDGNSATAGGFNFDQGGGGAIATPRGASASLQILDSTISGNTATNNGGGIFLDYGSSTLDLERSTISDNSTTYAFGGGGTGYIGGGGIAISGTPSSTPPAGFLAGTLIIRNSTITNNTTTGSGGGIQGNGFYGSLLIQNATITGNSAAATGGSSYFPVTFGGGGIMVADFGFGTPPVLTVENSVVAGNTNAGGEPDIEFRDTANINFSAIGDPTGFTPSGANNLPFGTDLKLGALADNGGPTQTMAPQAGSPLLDAGSDDLIPPGVGTDQRGIPYYRSFGAATDIGSVEVQPFSNAPFVTSHTTNIFGSGGTDYTFTVTYTDPGGTLLGIDVNSVIGNNNAIKVTGPNGFTQMATFVSIDTPSNGTPRTATYKITAPGGTWDGIDNGHYTVQMQANQVKDLDGEFAPQLNIGKFAVVVSPIIVTNANDSGPGSLHDAIDLANLDPGDDQIVFDPTFFNTPRTITLASPLPSIPATGGNLTITGPGVVNLKVDAGGQFRVLDSSAPELTLTGFEITGGLAALGTGGGLHARGLVTIDHMLFDNNTATGEVFVSQGGGGAIGMASGSFLHVSNSTITGNTATRNGGGILSYFGGLVVENSTLSGNTTTFTGSYYVYSGGGAIAFLGTPFYNPPAGFTPYTAVIKNCTIVGNSATGSGGAIVGFNQFGSPGVFLIQDSTITGNTAQASGVSAYGYPYGGGGISTMFGGSVVVQNSVVAGNNNASSPDILSLFNVKTSASLIGSTSGFTESDGSGNLAPGTDPMLGSLQDNGGPTQTMAPQTGSPLIDAGNDDLIPTGLGTDQRGPGFYRSFGNAVDIGSVEDQTISAGPFADANTTNIFGGGGTDYTFTVTYSDPIGTNIGIDVSSVIGNNNAIKVIGPNGFDQFATFVSIDDGTNGTPRTVTYTFNAPGGVWDGPDTGHYKIQMQANEVKDLDGDFAPQVNIGSFLVVVSPITVTNANNSGPGSLRDAIDLANLDPGDDEIIFDPIVFGTHQDITLQSGLPSIPFNSGNLTITGPGVNNVTIDAGGQFQILVSQAPVLTLSGMTFANGLGNNVNGGALLASGTVYIDSMNFTGNSVTGNSFGAGSGGAIGMGGFSFLKVTNSTISGNTAERDGGGIYFFSGGLLDLENSTISGNSTTDSTATGGFD